MSETYYSIKKSTLTGIADAIRGKTGDTTEIAVSGLAEAISGINGSDGIAHEDIPDYVKGEALRMAKLVKAKQDEITAAGGTPFTMLCMSDAHDAPTTSSVSAAANVTKGNIHAGMAAKVLAYALKLDACAYLGDYAWSYDSTSTDDNVADITAINERINEAFDGIPQFRTVGNHDSGDYEGDTYLTPAELYALIGSYNDDGKTVMGSTTAGYCYRDFADAKVRVICLNTADGGTNTVSSAQLAWFAQTLASTPSGYYVFCLSHHPPDYGGNPLLANILYACYNKSSITLSGKSYSFSSFAGTIAAWYHGHVHCYKVGNVNRISNGSGTEFPVKKIATPNMCYARNNEYGTTASYFGIVVGEATTYAKTADSAEDTAFVVNVFDPTSFNVYSYHYGAGYDRALYLGVEKVAVTGVALSAETLTVTKGSSSTLTATFTPSNATDQTGTWASSNPSIATVSSSGLVTGKGVGSAVITFTTTDGDYIASCSVTVEARVSTINTTHGVRLSTGSGTTKASADDTTTDYIPIDKETYPNGWKLTIANAGDVVGNGNPYRNSAVVLYHGTTFATATYICNANASPYTWNDYMTMTRTDDRTGATITSGSYNWSTMSWQLRLCVYDPDSTASFTIEAL